MVRVRGAARGVEEGRTLLSPRENGPSSVIDDFDFHDHAVDIKTTRRCVRVDAPRSLKLVRNRDAYVDRVGDRVLIAAVCNSMSSRWSSVGRRDDDE